MDRMQDEKIWQARDDLVYRKLVDGGMLYDGRSRKVHHLNATAARVWEACQQGKKTGEIVQELCRCFEVNAEQAGPDVEAILEDFAGAGLVQS